MIRGRSTTLVTIAAAAILSSGAGGSDAARPVESDASSSPAVAALRQASLPALAKRLSGKTREYADIVRTSNDPAKREEAASWLAFTPEAKDLVLALLVRERDPAVMRALLGSLSEFAHWKNEPRLRAVLPYVIEEHAEPTVVAAAVEQLRALEMHSLREAVARRIAREKRAGREDAVASLAESEDRAVNLDRGLMLPTFLRRPPPLFEKKVPGPAIRFLAFGDFGTGSEDQRKTAAAMREYHATHPFDFGITLGDNFYSEGMPSPNDARWKTQFEELYGPMGIEIFACFGNHDEYDPDSPIAEILYSARSQTWRLPAQFYTFTAGPVQFFAIDCNDMSELQRRWLRRALDESTARWKVVYGHFPPYLAMKDGNGELPEFAPMIMPILKGRADVYLAGHHHSLQHVQTVDGVHLFISGGGGAPTYEVDEASPRSVFARSEHGFAVVEVDADVFHLRFVDEDSRTLYETTVRK